MRRKKGLKETTLNLGDSIADLIRQLAAEDEICVAELNSIGEKQGGCPTYKSFFMRHQANVDRFWTFCYFCHPDATEGPFARFQQLGLKFGLSPEAARADAVARINRWVTDAAVDLFTRTFSLVEFECKKEILNREEAFEDVYKKFLFDPESGRNANFSNFIRESKMMGDKWRTQFGKLLKIRNFGIHNNFVAREDFTIRIEGHKLQFFKDNKPANTSLSHTLLPTREVRRLYREWLDNLPMEVATQEGRG